MSVGFIDLNSSISVITDADIPASIARDVEVSAEITVEIAEHAALVGVGNHLPTGGATAFDIANDAIIDPKIGDRTVSATTAPTNLGPGKLLDWLTWFVARFKAILGTSNWHDSPPITLTAAANHAANTSNPHATTASQVGAISTSASVTINTSDGIAGGGSLALNGGSLSLSMPATIPSDRTFTGNVTINGNFNVLGTEAVYNTTTVEYADVILRIAKNNTGIAPFAGLQAERGASDAWMLWNEASDRWTFYTGADTDNLTVAPIEGSSIYGINFYSSNFDIISAGTLNIGVTNATTINIGSAATNINFATGNQATIFTIGSVEDTLNVPAATITGITPAKIGAIAAGNVTEADVANDAITDPKIGDRTVSATTAPTNLGPGKLLDWLTWFVARFKAILGTSNWHDSPPITLTATANHVTNTSNPHNVTAQQLDFTGVAVPSHPLILNEDFFCAGLVGGTTGLAASTVAGGIVDVPAFVSESYLALSNFLTGNRVGFVPFTTSASGDRAAIYGPGLTIRSNANITFETEFYIGTISDATNRYYLVVGLHDQLGLTTPDEGIYFYYDDSTSANWRFIVANNGNAQPSQVTTVNTEVAVVFGDWTKLKFVVTGNTSVSAYINGTLVATITTNLPASTKNTYLQWRMTRTAGSATSRRLFLDKYSLSYVWV